MALTDSSSEFLRRLGGPTSRQIAMDANATKLADEKRKTEAASIYSQGVNTGIIKEDGKGNFEGIDYDKLFEQDKTGGYVNATFIPQLLNATKTFGQFLDTKEGVVKQGRVAGFAPGKEEGKVAIMNERPDTKLLRPKTWFASDDPNDYVAEVDQNELEQMMYGNVAALYNRAYGVKKAQSDRTLEQGKRLFGGGGSENLNIVGSQINEIDDSDAPLEDRNEALLNTIASISQDVTDYNVKAEEGRDTFGSISKEFVGGGAGLPWKTADTSAEGVKKGYETANAILNAPLNTTFSEEEVLAMISNAGVRAKEPFQNKLTKRLGYNSMEPKDWLELPQLIRRKEFLEAQPDDYTEKGKKRVVSGPKTLTGVSTTGGTTSVTGLPLPDGTIKTKEELLEQVNYDIANGNSQLREAASITKAEYEKDDKAIKDYAETKIRKPKQDRLDKINEELTNEKTPLSEGRRQELEAQKAKLEKELSVFKLTSVEGIEPLTDLPELDKETGNFNQEELENWFINNKQSLTTISEDGETAAKVKEMIINYEIQTLEDMEKAIAAGAAEEENVTPTEVAAILAKTSTGDFTADFVTYLGAFGSEQTRQQDMIKTQQDMFITADDYRKSTEKYYNQLGDEFITLNEELIETIYGSDGDGKFDLGDEAQMGTLRLMSTKLKNLPGAPRFEYVQGKLQIVSGATPEIDDAVKTYVGQLFKAVVETEGSVDWKDYWADVFGPNDAGGLANIVSEIQFTRNPDGSIREIFLTPAGSNREAEGSLKPPDLAKYFGSKGNYMRDLLLAYISQNGQEREF